MRNMTTEEWNMLSDFMRTELDKSDCFVGCRVLIADAEAALSDAAKMMKETETKESSMYCYWQGRYDAAEIALDRAKGLLQRIDMHPVR